MWITSCNFLHPLPPRTNSTITLFVLSMKNQFRSPSIIKIELWKKDSCSHRHSSFWVQIRDWALDVAQIIVVTWILKNKYFAIQTTLVGYYIKHCKLQENPGIILPVDFFLLWNTVCFSFPVDFLLRTFSAQIKYWHYHQKLRPLK